MMQTAFIQTRSRNQYYATQNAAAKFFTYDVQDVRVPQRAGRPRAADARNRLVDFRTGTLASTIVSQYQFNAKGERVRKYKGTVDQSRYLYSEGGQLLVQNRIVSGVTTTQEIIWLDDMPIGVNQGGSLHGILTDHLNSPRAVFQLNNQIKVWRWDAVDDAFGEKLAVEDPDANSVLFKFDMRFAGQFYDSESGLHYNYLRDGYDSQNGRYTQSDPIGLNGGMSTYGYVGGSPLNSTDPFGLFRYGAYVSPSQLVMIGGRYINRSRAQAESWRLWGHGSFPGEENSSMRHCTVSCILGNRIGRTPARAAGVANEYIGLVRWDIGRLPSRMSGETPWAFQFDDLANNERGFHVSKQVCDTGDEGLVNQCRQKCEMSMMTPMRFGAPTIHAAQLFSAPRK
jgi:RHS repeat-associated protein